MSTFFSWILSWIFGVAIVMLILVAGFAVLWLAFGRKKKAEDKAIGILEQMAHFKATNSVDVAQRRIR